MPLDGTMMPRSVSEFRLPGPRDRLAVLGRTGSGKTHAACWALSHADYRTKPWVIVDYKRDEMIRALPCEELKVSDRLPKEPGLYAVRPNPSDSEAVEDLLLRIWRRGRVGVYIDEGHMLPDKGGLEALLTQGRSKSIPVIVLSQRPVWLNRYAISEADYIQLFHLNDKRDRQTIGGFMPAEAQMKLERRHSWYYDIAADRLFHMLPVPGRDELLSRFYDRNPRRVRAKVI
jgi:hypothetical protein